MPQFSKSAPKIKKIGANATISAQKFWKKKLKNLDLPIFNICAKILIKLIKSGLLPNFQLVPKKLNTKLKKFGLVRIFKMCPKILKKFKFIVAYAAIFKMTKEFWQKFKTIGAYTPIFKLCPKILKK